MDAERIQLTARVLALSALCPHCGTASTAVHSYYTRQPRDLPLSGQAVRLLLHLRRFRCRAATCPVVTFSERLPTLIIPAAQRTVRLNRVLRDLALAFGGQAGARQCARTAMAASGATLLRRAHTAALPELTTPRILGIDDFAFCKGQIYGTILTDGETHAVVDLLPNRTAKTTAAWLKSHPGIDVVTRDRAGEYARGVRVGAPKAVQVADRFHLIKNAGEVLEHVVLRHHDGLRSAAKAVDQERDALTLPTMSSPAAAPESRTAPGPSTRQQPHSRQRRFAQYQEVLALAAQGLGPTTIAARTGLTRQTVARWLQARTFPERAAATPRTMLVTPYEPYLRERWQAGEHNSRQLWREIQAQGFKGGCETVRRLTVHWHTERGRSGPPPKHQATKPTSRRAPPAPATRPLSPRQARWLFLKSEAELKPEQRLYLEHLGRNNPDVHTAQQLVVAFLQLVRKREPESLEPWIQSAQASGVAELMEFAKGLVRDRAAVEAALRYKWSNGITEGHVNRLKMIKRTAYGRASFALLRQRVLAQV
jgi:transposase